ncbi:MAG: hypothetical protein KIT34_04925 [Cyanobacteria bacterium TGS_CYA1]|nr:hypothetical protein [Cyanobacteria bacterium TGS_CYA1]
MFDDLKDVDDREREIFDLPKNFSQESVRVIRLAFIETSQHSHPSVELVHILLGLARESSSPTIEHLLHTETVNLLSLRAALKGLKPRGPGYSLHIILDRPTQALIEKLGKYEDELVEPIDILKELINWQDELVMQLLNKVGFVES